MTAQEAQELQDRVTASGGWVIWQVSMTSPRHPQKAVAWATIPDKSGGRQEGEDLVVDTLEGLRAMLPAGLDRHDRTPFLAAHVIETWD